MFEKPFVALCYNCLVHTFTKLRIKDIPVEEAHGGSGARQVVVMIRCKRIYDSPDDNDGYRVLVDRLWPRGVSKANAHIDLWLKDIAPSNTLRKWFGHDTKKWEIFEKKYQEEIRNKDDLLNQLRDLVKEHKKVTLLFGAKDERRNQAVVLAKILKSK